jgi:hypothetical protein
MPLPQRLAKHFASRSGAKLLLLLSSSSDEITKDGLCNREVYWVDPVEVP